MIKMPVDESLGAFGKPLAPRETHKGDRGRSLRRNCSHAESSQRPFLFKCQKPRRLEENATCNSTWAVWISRSERIRWPNGGGGVVWPNGGGGVVRPTPDPLLRRPRYPRDPGLVRTSVDHQHRRLHGAGAEPVQGLLARLEWVGPRSTGGAAIHLIPRLGTHSVSRSCARHTASV
jgi:hypothetical protein